MPKTRPTTPVRAPTPPKFSEYGKPRVQAPVLLNGVYTKICRFCRQTKPWSVEHFPRSRGLPNGNVCLECKRELRIQRYKEDEAFREANKAGAMASYRKAKATKEYRARRQEYKVNRKKNDPAFALRISMGNAILSMFKNYLRGTKKRNRTWRMFVPFTEHELKEHLEAKFIDGMSWENRGFWEIDHIIPTAWWDIKSVDDPDFKRCWSLKNLQPLWQADNLKKKNYWAIINGKRYTRNEWIAAGRPMPS